MSYPILNLRQLGSGGNGDIYVGQRSDTGEWVVVKYLRESHLPHARKPFLNERYASFNGSCVPSFP